MITEVTDPQAVYWIPPSPIDEARLIDVLSKMVRHFLMTSESEDTFTSQPEAEVIKFEEKESESAKTFKIAG